MIRNSSVRVAFVTSHGLHSGHTGNERSRWRQGTGTIGIGYIIRY
jgi:hypothetical protein